MWVARLARAARKPKRGRVPRREPSSGRIKSPPTIGGDFISADGSRVAFTRVWLTSVVPPRDGWQSFPSTELFSVPGKTPGSLTFHGIIEKLQAPRPGGRNPSGFLVRRSNALLAFAQDYIPYRSSSFLFPSFPAWRLNEFFSRRAPTSNPLRRFDPRASIKTPTLLARAWLAKGSFARKVRSSKSWRTYAVAGA